jgi:hypothetical protein
MEPDTPAVNDGDRERQCASDQEQPVMMTDAENDVRKPSWKHGQEGDAHNQATNSPNTCDNTITTAHVFDPHNYVNEYIGE